MDCGSTIVILLAFIQATCGQTPTLTGPSEIERGMDTVLTCNEPQAQSSYVFIWTDISVNPNVLIFTAKQKADPQMYPKYVNFEISEDDAGTSIMTIENTEIEDEGRYTCREGAASSEEINLTVEVRYALSLDVPSIIDNNIDMYNATCDALNGRPEVTITWMLGDSGSPCNPVEEDLTPADPDLLSKRSVCTFQATSENYEETLRCIISGHQVAGLNGEETFTLDIHSAPRNGTIEVGFQLQNLNLRVSCDIVEGADQPNPIMRNYYITSNGTSIHQSDTGVNSVVVQESEFDIYTQFVCTAGNYLGNTTSEVETYEPVRTTTPSPPAATVTPPMTGDGKNNTKGGPSAAAALSVGEIVGIVIGAILGVIIIVLVIYFVWKKGNPGSTAASSTKKHGSSAVGTSNGSEKNDVAAPLNSVNEVVTEDKIKPVAAPRDQGSIQHTTDNPGQAEYAMVDRKKPGGGDMPDTRGPGQKEPPQGMLYADLDLSASAGHTEKKVPQNKDDVVVYSSILV